MNDAIKTTLDRLDARYSGELLTITDAAEFCGVSRETVRKYLRINPVSGRISKVDLAVQITSAGPDARRRGR